MMRMIGFFVVLGGNLLIWIWLVWKLFLADHIGTLSMGGGVLVFFGFACQILFFGIQSALAVHGWQKRLVYGFWILPLLCLIFTILLSSELI